MDFGPLYIRASRYHGGMDAAALMSMGVKMTKEDKKKLRETKDRAGAGAMANQDIPLAMRPTTNEMSQLASGMK